jgi:hypothetical protein
LVRWSSILFRYQAAFAAPEFKARTEIWTDIISLAGNRNRGFVVIGLKLLPSGYAIGRI